MATRLTDKTVENLRPKRAAYFVWDAATVGLGIKVTPKHKKIWVAQLKYPGHRAQSRRTVGLFPAVGLAMAREKAREWHAWAKAGIDPAVEEAKAAAAATHAAALAERHSFTSVAEAYVARVLPGLRWGARVEHQIRKELLPAWGSKHIAEITRHDVVALIDALVARPPTRRRSSGGTAYAHNIFVVVRSLFNWAAERGVYGLEALPTDRIKPVKLIGKHAIRTRVLNDTELRKLWTATHRVGYPYGPMVRMLLLTGCRVSEVRGARWREFDFANRVWTVPAERFKSEVPHTVPLTDDLLTLLGSLPRLRRGDFLFSTTDGAKPISNGPSGMRQRLDREMGEVAPWILHDLRRVVRSNLSKLAVPEHVAELAIGHGRRGLARIYDQHGHLEEIRAAMTAWEGRLREIVGATPTPAPNVVRLRR
jgi:integrase